MKIKTEWAEYTLTGIEVGKYASGDRLAIELYCLDEEYGGEAPLATLTVNLTDYWGLKENQAFVDTNNCPWAKNFIKETDIGYETGIEWPSGYCFYPLYTFDMDKIKKLQNKLRKEI